VKCRENLTRKSYRLSTSPIRCSHCTFGNRKKVIFNSIIHAYLWLGYLQYLTSKTIYNSLGHSPLHLKMSPLWLVNCETFSSDWRFVAFFQTLEALKRAGCGLSSVAVKQPVVMSGNWNVRQAISQQVFKVTTFCINTCFQSFSSSFSRVVHHAVLKFSPCRNKPLPQALTCPY